MSTEGGDQEKCCREGRAPSHAATCIVSLFLTHMKPSAGQCDYSNPYNNSGPQAFSTLWPCSPQPRIVGVLLSTQLEKWKEECGVGDTPLPKETGITLSHSKGENQSCSSIWVRSPGKCRQVVCPKRREEYAHG